MGEARNRGTRDERVAAATPKQTPERQYAPRMIVRTKMLDYLWSNFKVFGDITVGDIRAMAVAEQKRLAAERAAKEQLNDEVVSDRIAAESGSPQTSLPLEG